MSCAVRANLQVVKVRGSNGETLSTAQANAMSVGVRDASSADNL